MSQNKYPYIVELNGFRPIIGGEQSRSWIVDYLVMTGDLQSTWMRQAEIRKRYQNKGWEKMINQYIQFNKPVKIKKEKEKEEQVEEI